MSIANQVTFPSVVKPLLLSGSRGVIRADTPDEFIAAFERTSPFSMHRECLLMSEVLVERFVEGFEVALEGLLTDGRLERLHAIRQAGSARWPLLRRDDLCHAFASAR
ncbi:MAG: ATP-grasp domain-containing protein [Thermomicrobiales bacterium]